MTTYSSILGASMVLNSNKMKDKNRMIILIYAEKTLDKPQQPFMIKNSKKKITKEMYLNAIKAKNSTIINNENLKSFPLRSGRN